MSRDDTGRRTDAALRSAGITVYPLPELSDVDHPADVAAAAALCAPSSAFAAVAARLSPVLS